MKQLTSLLLILVLMLGLLSCGASSDNEPIAESTTYPVTVTDHAGRAVTIEQKPERLVSGY